MSEPTNSNEAVKRPNLFWLLTETGRALSEFSLSIPYRTFSKNQTSGDSHPVLVLPGFMASDFSTNSLRKFIQKLGYIPYGWELGRNYARLQYLKTLEKKVEEIYEVHKEPISLIGWSLGGVFARQIAKAKPHLIRQIITLGSPFRNIKESNNATWLYNLLPGSKRVVDLNRELLNDLPNPAPVPTTAVYSKEDGIVPWEVCMEVEEGMWHQNVQIRGSHLGMGVNPAILDIIADRLLYDKTNWEHFIPKSFVKDLLFYPSL